MKQQELKKLVGVAMKKSLRISTELSGTTNPQSVAVLDYHMAAYDALSAVMNAINNNPISLRIMGL